MMLQRQVHDAAWGRGGGGRRRLSQERVDLSEPARGHGIETQSGFFFAKIVEERVSLAKIQPGF